MLHLSSQFLPVQSHCASHKMHFNAPANPRHAINIHPELLTNFPETVFRPRHTNLPSKFQRNLTPFASATISKQQFFESRAKNAQAVGLKRFIDLASSRIPPRGKFKMNMAEFGSEGCYSKVRHFLMVKRTHKLNLDWWIVSFEAKLILMEIKPYNFLFFIFKKSNVLPKRWAWKGLLTQICFVRITLLHFCNLEWIVFCFLSFHHQHQ